MLAEKQKKMKCGGRGEERFAEGRTAEKRGKKERRTERKKENNYVRKSHRIRQTTKYALGFYAPLSFKFPTEFLCIAKLLTSPRGYGRNKEGRKKRREEGRVAGRKTGGQETHLSRSVPTSSPIYQCAVQSWRRGHCHAGRHCDNIRTKPQSLKTYSMGITGPRHFLWLYSFQGLRLLALHASNSLQHRNKPYLWCMLGA